MARLNVLLGEVKDVYPPRSREIETLKVLIQKYDDEHYQLPDASPAGGAAIPHGRTRTEPGRSARDRVRRA